MRPVPVLLATALLILLTCGCSQSPPAATPAATTVPTQATLPPVTTMVWTPAVTPTMTASVSDNTILIAKNSFTPANMTVKVGSTVRWVNADDHPHRIAFNKAGFLEVPYLLGASQSASQRFDSPGSYDFFCTIHPQMQGTIVAEA